MLNNASERSFKRTTSQTQRGGRSTLLERVFDRSFDGLVDRICIQQVIYLIKHVTRAIVVALMLLPLIGQSSNADPFAHQYFNAWVASQAPNATEDDLNNYLALLTEDVGHQHLPYDPDSSRESENEILSWRSYAIPSNAYRCV